ncbi:TetR/AcrR family transcriptional regulator [Mycobacterium sp. 1081908.1]|uniref:TetR/AcrR family transcriptional regulator n=1 Tax=Mycobacterium sp. 1081908.1 TaxID=1834066 RepID=UPI0007FCB43F|nr:TetR/AcrR family transcriptional regulator [Mycobacterium sp. 1081908.1]OBK43146.1 TetR family transcriptional regulator [Mycobacterium sp. 1081908.1]
MGKKGAATRSALIDSTQTLIESGGYFGTGLNQVLADSGAPRGSLYFHFPGGKDELICEAIRQAGNSIDAIIDGIEAANTSELMTVLLRALGQRLEESDWNQGCPVATVALETSASNDAIQQACSAAYRDWHKTLCKKLEADGRVDTDDMATFLLAVLEGAMVLARTHRRTDPLDAAIRIINNVL